MHNAPIQGMAKQLCKKADAKASSPPQRLTMSCTNMPVV